MEEVAALAVGAIAVCLEEGAAQLRLVARRACTRLELVGAVGEAARVAPRAHAGDPARAELGLVDRVEGDGRADGDGREGRLRVHREERRTQSEECGTRATELEAPTRLSFVKEPDTARVRVRSRSPTHRAHMSADRLRHAICRRDLCRRLAQPHHHQHLEDGLGPSRLWHKGRLPGEDSGRTLRRPKPKIL